MIANKTQAFKLTENPFVGQIHIIENAWNLLLIILIIKINDWN